MFDIYRYGRVAMAGAAASLLWMGAAVSAPITIDDFNDASDLVQNGVGTAVGRTSGAMIGGERDESLQVLTDSDGAGGINRAQFTVNNAGNSLANLINDAGVESTLTLQYDGNADTNAAELDPTGLGGVDISSGGVNTGISIEVAFDDLPVNGAIRLYSDAANWSEATFSVPGLVFADTTYFIQFDEFDVMAGAGADLASIGAMEFVFDGFPGLDFRFDFIGITVPEPSGLAGLLVGAGLLAGTVARRGRSVGSDG